MECEVKWAIGSTIMNKASGGNGIPVELIQILKDDAVKILHSICQQIWKSQQWHRTGKGQSSFRSQRKAYLSLLAILWNSAFKWVYLSFSPFPSPSLLFSDICKASSDNHFAFFFAFLFLGAGALGRPRGMVWGGRREEGSGWGTHVYLWWIHFDIWQN